MALRRIQVSDFRCLQSAALDFDPKFTLISGPNASGKTSLLESIYVLGRGRSFRTRHLDHLMRTGADRFVIFGEVEDVGRTGLGVEGSAEGMRARLRGERVSSLAELATVLPVQIIDPEVHRLIEEGPSHRRRFLDWGVFHVEHSFVERLQRYQQALKQRNGALRARQPRAMVSAWDGELLRSGILIHESRVEYVSRLEVRARDIARGLLGQELTLGYRPGWPKDKTFQEALADNWQSDSDAGSTQVGPQRAEVTIRLNDSPVKDRISRGQQKLLAAALLLAQLDLLPTENATSTLLLDDPAAELDSDRLLSLIQEVMRNAVQLIVTSLNPDFRALGAPGQRYLAESGTFSLAPS